jgi:hypothetical protein
MNKTFSIALTMSFIFFFSSSFLYSYPDGWSDDILLTPEDSDSRMQPDVGVDGFNFIWVVWDSGTWVSGTAEILYSKRDSLGSSLIPETGVSNNPSFSHLPKVAVDASNNVHSIWRDAPPQGEGVWHAKLANDGAMVVPSHLAVSGAGGGSSTLRPEMAINKYNEIHIVWDEAPSGYNQMNYTKLDSLGNPIITKIRVSPEGIYAYWPGIGVDSMANNHLAYRTDTTTVADRLTYSKLDNNGNFLISNKILGLGLLPTIIDDRTQNIHMVYLKHTSSRNDICYLKLDNNGNIIIPSKQLNLTQHIHNNCPHMAMDSSQYLHVVWETEISGIFPIMYTKLDTLGNFVIPPMQVVYPPYTQGGGGPRIAVDRSNRLHLIWVDQRLNPGVSTDVFYKRGENETSVKETERLKVANLPKISVFPNPFSRETKIVFSLSCEIEKLRFEIHDVIGREVKEFIPDKADGFIIWHGTDDFGNYLPAGVYFLRVMSSVGGQSIPIILLK